MVTMNTRIIPNLLIKDGALVKTRKFAEFQYVGDPCNTLRIFNELEVDEILLLDISASRYTKGVDFNLLKDCVDECFVPLAYGGGINSLSDANKIFRLGVEKVVINTALIENPSLIEAIAKVHGNQSVIASIDVRKIAGSYVAFSHSGTRKVIEDIYQLITQYVDLGAGEILLTAIDNEGTWSGYDNELIRSVSERINVPVIANGGAGSIQDLVDVVQLGKASACGVGSLVVFQKEGNGVLVNFSHSKYERVPGAFLYT